MPCQYETPEERLSGAYASFDRAIDIVTRAACDMRTILRRHGLERELCKDTREWIASHDKADAKRIAEEEARGERERMRQAALDKLNLDERRILGL